MYMYMYDLMTEVVTVVSGARKSLSRKSIYRGEYTCMVKSTQVSRSVSCAGPKWDSNLRHMSLYRCFNQQGYICIYQGSFNVYVCRQRKLTGNQRWRETSCTVMHINAQCTYIVYWKAVSPSSSLLAVV